MRFILVLLFISLRFTSKSQLFVEFRNEDNAEKIPFVTVTWKCDSISETSKADSLGRWKLPKLFSFNSCNKITVTHPNYKLIELTISEANQVFFITPTTKEIEDVVITAQINRTTADNAIHKVHIITAEKIIAKGAINLRDALQNEMNIRISQDQILGSGITLKGIGGEGVKILIDGIPMIGRNDGNIDLSQIPVTMIERIEIIEGPLSVNYGSNAIAGTINIITKSKSKKGHSFQLSPHYETIGNYNLQGAYQFRKENHSILINGGRNYFNGWNTTDNWDFIPEKTIADSSRFKAWKPKEQLNATLRYSFVSKHLKISPFVDVFKESILNRGYPRPPFLIQAIDEKYRTNRTNFGLSLDWNHLNSKIKFTGGINHYNRLKNAFVKDLTTLNETLSSDLTTHDTTQFILNFSRISYSNFKKDALFNYEIGGEYNNEIGKGTRLDEVSKNILDLAIYGISEITIKKISLNPGIRYNYNSNYGQIIIPAINVKYNLKNFILRGSYANGFRTPSLKELYLEFIDINHNITGNPNLLPEKSNHFQFWIQHKDSIKNALLTTELNPYFQVVSDKIVLSQKENTTEYSYFNLNQFRSIGSQLLFSYQLKTFKANLGFGFIATQTSLELKNWGNSPEITFNSNYEFPKAKLTISVFYKFTGKTVNFIQSENNEVQQVFTQAYHMLDLQLQKSLFKNHLKVSLGAKNLLNVTSINTSIQSNAHSGGAQQAIATGRVYYLSFNFTINTFK